jgi:hypothetical protein
MPNTVCWQKDYDTALTEYKFNNCGHRAGMECEEKKKGAYRVVLIGSSVSFGMSVPRENTFAALLPSKLSQLTGRKVEVYNASMLGDFPPTLPHHLDAALALHPDLILWVVTTPDIKNTSPLLPHDDAPESIKKRNILARALYRVQYSLATNNAQSALTEIFEHGFVWLTKTPTGVMLCHLLYATPSQYLRSYLQGRDSEYGFLRTEPSAEWKSGVQEFTKIATEVENTTKAAGVPLVTTLFPSRGQVTMLSMGKWKEGFDPYLLDNELRMIMVNRGGIYIDMLPGYRNIEDPGEYYYAVEGHPNARGQELISQVLAKQLTSGAIPALKAKGQQ